MNAETWTNPLIQRSKVFGLTYTLQISFTSTLSRTLTYLFCSVVLSVAKLLEHYFRINSKRYYFLPTKTDVSPACEECVIHDVLHNRHVEAKLSKYKGSAKKRDTEMKIHHFYVMVCQNRFAISICFHNFAYTQQKSKKYGIYQQ